MSLVIVVTSFMVMLFLGLALGHPEKM